MTHATIQTAFSDRPDLIRNLVPIFGSSLIYIQLLTASELAAHPAISLADAQFMKERLQERRIPSRVPSTGMDLFTKRTFSGMKNLPLDALHLVTHPYQRTSWKYLPSAAVKKAQRQVPDVTVGKLASMNRLQAKMLTHVSSDDLDEIQSRLGLWDLEFQPAPVRELVRH